MSSYEAYCMRCREKRPIQDAKADFNAAGAPVTRGVCPVCGTALYRMGRTPEHENLPKPEITVKNRSGGKNAPKRSGKLVIVESPAKARTVGRYLGKEFTVKASVGHVRDLLKSQISVDVENNFAPKYRVPKEKLQVVKELRSLAQKAAEIYLATDPDREGEAIAWHLTEAIESDPAITRRVEFHEITKPAVSAAFEHPRAINMDLVDAQQARRVLDRLVGYNLSPLLWQKVRSRLSAGRVQSVALRMIVEREREIDAFVPQEYWTIHVLLNPHGHPKDRYRARLVRINVDDVNLPDQARADAVVRHLDAAAYQIDKIKRGERRRKPQAPFTTSTMQQEASVKLGYTAKRSMALAQQLYEGLDVGEGGSTGLITYMRTDSTNVSDGAQKEAREYIVQRYGDGFVPETPPVYKTRAKGAQEAHEAIRPTSVLRTPEAMKSKLEPAQLRLYRLIWQRFVASQMEAAVFDTQVVDIDARSPQFTDVYTLRISGSTLRFPGFLSVYEEMAVEDPQEDEEPEIRIPRSLKEGQAQDKIEVQPEQHFTAPPPRFTEASLVKALEENGIGRPSTYAPILSTLQQRDYVQRQDKRLIPTETGLTVNDLIMSHFPDIVDVGFTARMEEDLDLVASGERAWSGVLQEFYGPFAEQIARAQAEMPEVKSEPERLGRACPDCGHELVIRYGRFGKFISCSNFPTCRYTEPWLEKIGVTCPKDGGDLVERKTRKGRTFYGCMNYPACDFTSWKRPLAQPCPNCGGLLLVQNKKQAQCSQCENLFDLEDVGDQVEEMA